MNDFYNALGIVSVAKIYEDIFSSASNVILTDNPSFSKEDFSSVFPQFSFGDTNQDNQDNIPDIVFNIFLSMANAALKYDRYKSSWKYLMCLYIAHFCSLYLMTTQGDGTAQSILRSAVPPMVATSKSVDGLSISYDTVGVYNDFSKYGTWALTSYGAQLVTLIRIYSGAGMWVR